MFDSKKRIKSQRKIEDVVAPHERATPDTRSADVPPPPPAALPLSHRSRRRVSGVLVGLLVVAVVVVGVEGSRQLWHYARAELATIQLFGVKPIASQVLPSMEEGNYPKTLAGLAAYIHDLVVNAQDIVRPSLRVAGEVQTLANLVPHALNGTRGDEFIASLSRLKDAVADFNAHASDRGGTANVSSSMDQGFGALARQTHDAQALLEQSIAWLAQKDAHRIAVLFGNTAEMRPGGGFVGSYAEVAIEGGAVKEIIVHDINDVDRGFEKNIIPPRALQPLVRRWRAADANWFFNGPDSAEQLLAFMNASRLYADRDLQLDGVVALSPQLIQGVLALTGPLELEDGTEITAESFLRVIQSDVQEGHDTGSNDPKAILAELVPLVMGKMSDDGAGRVSGVQLLALVYSALQDKSMTVYFTDDGLQSIVDRYGWGGRLYDLPRNFVGDYVGVTLSNVGGAKTDLVIENTIAIRENVLPSGLLETTVTLTRVHRGDKESAWYYKAPYEGYVQLYTPPDVGVLSASGMWDRDFNGRAYGSDFISDAAVAAIEKSTVELPQAPGLFASNVADRSALSFWQHFNAGVTATAEISYARPLPDPVLPGARYTFVIEKQPASTASYEIEIAAPPGYVWEESQSSLYDYATTDLPARLVFQLTLQREN